MKFEGSTLNFTYDASGTPLTMSIGDAVYYYVTNLQGDVVGLLDATGARVVTYTYDAWGVGLTVTGTKANSIGMLNPLRYRGYVYDVGTGLYYLQSRYYDPQVGRFLNADAFTSTGQGFLGNNMFAYCNNQPITCVDYSGAVCKALNSSGRNVYEYIYDQDEDPYGSKKLHDVTVSYGGCGVVASYNALITLGNGKSFDDVLAYYNADANRTFMRGNLGIMPGQVATYFESLGYSTITANSFDGIDVLSKKADACIMFYLYDAQEDIHGVNLTLPRGHFVEYEYVENCYIGRNTLSYDGVACFKDPLVFFGQQEKSVYTEVVFIFKQER